MVDDVGGGGVSVKWWTDGSLLGVTIICDIYSHYIE